MRFTSLLPLALVAAPAAVSAAGNFGFSLGVKNPDGSCKTQSDFEQDFDVLEAHTKVVRTYSASDCSSASNLVAAAKSKGFKVVLGMWWVTVNEIIFCSRDGNADSFILSGPTFPSHTKRTKLPCRRLFRETKTS
jgi:hypothetical protein